MEKGSALLLQLLEVFCYSCFYVSPEAKGNLAMRIESFRSNHGVGECVDFGWCLVLQARAFSRRQTES